MYVCMYVCNLFFIISSPFPDWLKFPGLLFITRRSLPYLEVWGNIPYWNTDCPNMHSQLVVSRQRRGNQAVLACVPNSRKWKKLQNYCEKLNETNARTQKYNAFNRRSIYTFVFFNLMNIPLDNFLFSSSFFIFFWKRDTFHSVF